MRGDSCAGKVERMPTSYLPYERNQNLLLSHSLQEWLLQGHLAQFISGTIDATRSI